MNRVVLLSLLAVGFAADQACAQSYGGPIVPAITIPGAPFDCLASGTVTRSMVVSGGPTSITTLSVGMGFASQLFADLYVTITSPAGTQRQIKFQNCWGVNAYIGNSVAHGNYTIQDSAPTSWDAAANAITNGQPIPSGTYSGSYSLAIFNGQNANGTWIVRFQDLGSGTWGFSDGSLTALTLDFGTAPVCPGGSVTAYTIGQIPAGVPGAPLFIKHHCGDPLATYFGPIVPNNPSSIVTGWFYGLDIPVADLIAQAVYGPPFFGTLDANGNYQFSIGLPPGISLYSIAVHFDPTTGLPSWTSGPVSYTTI